MIALSELVSEQWVVETALTKRAEEALSDFTKLAVKAAVERFDPPNTPEGHRRHAELRRYLKARKGK